MPHEAPPTGEIIFMFVHERDRDTALAKLEKSFAGFVPQPEFTLRHLQYENTIICAIGIKHVERYDYAALKNAMVESMTGLTIPDSKITPHNLTQQFNYHSMQENVQKMIYLSDHRKPMTSFNIAIAMLSEGMKWEMQPLGDLNSERDMVFEHITTEQIVSDMAKACEAIGLRRDVDFSIIDQTPQGIIQPKSLTFSIHNKTIEEKPDAAERLLSHARRMAISPNPGTARAALGLQSGHIRT